MRARRLRCAPSVQARLFDNELVILDMDRGEYLALDPIGARLWQALETGADLERLAHDVVTEFDVTFEKVTADFDALISELLARGLLVPEHANDRR